MPNSTLLILAGVMLLLAVQNAFQRDYLTAGAQGALSVGLVVAHFIRLRRLKDRARHFDRP